MEIKGLLKLTEDQKQHMFRVNEIHVACNGTERQKNMQITEAWVDKDNCVCVRLANGEWYHYYSNQTWG
jgi:hypothetical protein